ncbi:hypothetical protein SAMN03080615_00863 [Amphritea atlantica]|uniref:Uncharacterized protein n=1 Tax=Amphritea atlantica TaxID=355243 RepID=A0A1H9EF28_9GAMM|nr:hypothetical protein [Amphritea atlantica]SEQ24235.1 hypothetical protein SAMN03080615_00863 [Amphritea atlantica]
MQLTRCPICHSRLSLESLVQDEAGRDLLALLARLEKNTGTALVTYIGLFRSPSRDLANDRALRLANEALELAEPNVLTAALVHTVESMRAKQQLGHFKPLSNHNYLRRVLESGQGADIPALPAGLATTNRRSARAVVSSAIMDIKDTDW